jgi:hypothetical protein
MRKRSTSLAATLAFCALLHGVATADTASCPLSTSVFPVSFLALDPYEVRVTDGGIGDLDGTVDGACSLAVTACLGTAACTAAPVERVRVGVRGKTIGATPRDIAGEILAAFASLPGAARDGNAVRFSAGDAPQACAQSRVRLPATQRSDPNLSIRLSTRDARTSASARLRLRCVPVDESGQPAAPICVALVRAWCPIEPGEPGAPTVTTSTTTTTTAIGGDPSTTTSTAGPSETSTTEVATAPTTTTTQPLPPSGRTYYISPAGGDDASGTSRHTAFRHFSKAIRMLAPGDVLVVLSGTYTRETTGLPRIDCDSNAANGTEAAPITIRAENEREAFLSSDGHQAGFEMSNCRWWTVEGLRAASRDNTVAEQGGGYPFRFSWVENVTLRRLLGSHNNRPQNTHVYAIENSSHVLLEECEAYFYHRHGFSIWRSYGVTLRRCYANSMKYGERGCCSDIDTREFGDEAISMYGSSQTIVENCVSENFANGFQIHGIENPLDPSGSGGRYNQVLGSISIDDEVGGLVSSRETGGEYHNALGNVFRDYLAVTPVGNGLHLRGAWDTEVENVTLYGSTDAAGLLVDGGDAAIGGSCGADNRLGCGFSARNVLSVQNRGAGVAADEQQSWDVQHSNAVGSDADWFVGEAFADASGHVQRSISRDPGPVGLGQGECIAWIPDGSPMKGAGENGADIGANIVYRYENGVLTRTPLWDPATGAFPCGAVVPDINDGARACRNLHERLNVNTNGCRLPLH